MTAGADGITPDAKDWTWVLDRPCPDCGFDAANTHHTAVAEHIDRDARGWAHRLTETEVTTRPAPGVWSVLEYGCHVRDVHRMFDHRVRLMLTEQVPTFPNWDQDQTALADDYGSQQPTIVAGELLAAAIAVSDTYRTVPADAWPRRGLRSNGSEFTIASIALYHLHDVVHHSWDVTAGHPKH